MKKLLVALTALALAVALLPGCTGQKYTPGNLPDKQLHWGYGGGFAGQETAFILLENGQIFRREGMGGNVQEIKGTKRKTAKALFSLFRSDLKKYDFNHPGNTYSYVQWQEGSAIHRVAWGDERFPVDQKAKDFFNQINGLVIQTN